MSAFSRRLVHLCNIQRFTASQNEIGEPVESWNDIAASVACRYVEKEEKFADENTGLQMLTVYRLLLPAGTDVTTADRISRIAIENDEVITDPATGQPQTFGIEEKLTRRGAKGQSHISLKLEVVG
jgi:head-tail adaptor